MKRLEFDCIFDLADIMDTYVKSNISDDKYPSISVFAPFEIAKILIEDLILLGNSLGCIVELEDYEMSHYDKEYCIELTEDGISSEKIYHKDRYYDGGGDISYVHEDCNSKLLNHIESETVYEFGIGDNKYIADIDCCNCADESCPNKCSQNADKSKEKDEKYTEYSKDEDGDIHGFTVSKSDDNSYTSYSYYTSEKLDNNDVNKMLKIIGF